MSKGYENALQLVTRTIDRIMTGEIQLQDLVVSKLLKKVQEDGHLKQAIIAANNHYAGFGLRTNFEICCVCPRPNGRK
jgi:hypothetical protein